MGTRAPLVFGSVVIKDPRWFVSGVSRTTRCDTILSFTDLALLFLPATRRSRPFFSLSIRVPNAPGLDHPRLGMEG